MSCFRKRVQSEFPGRKASQNQKSAACPDRAIPNRMDGRPSRFGVRCEPLSPGSWRPAVLATRVCSARSAHVRNALSSPISACSQARHLSTLGAVDALDSCQGLGEADPGLAEVRSGPAVRGRSGRGNANRLLLRAPFGGPRNRGSRTSRTDLQAPPALRASLATGHLGVAGPSVPSDWKRYGSVQSRFRHQASQRLDPSPIHPEVVEADTRRGSDVDRALRSAQARFEVIDEPEKSAAGRMNVGVVDSDDFGSRESCQQCLQAPEGLARIAGNRDRRDVAATRRGGAAAYAIRTVGARSELAHVSGAERSVYRRLSDGSDRGMQPILQACGSCMASSLAHLAIKSLFPRARSAFVVMSVEHRVRAARRRFPDRVRREERDPSGCARARPATSPVREGLSLRHERSMRKAWAWRSGNGESSVTVSLPFA